MGCCNTQPKKVTTLTKQEKLRLKAIASQTDINTLYNLKNVLGKYFFPQSFIILTPLF